MADPPPSRSEFLVELWKDARKKIFWAILALVGLYGLTLLGKLLKLGRTPEWSEVPGLLLAALKSYFETFADPLEYAAAHPLLTAIIVLLVAISLLLFILFRRGRRRLIEQRTLLDGLAKFEALAVRSGHKEWWPHAAKDGSGAPWDALRADIERAENNSLCILGANGLETFGAPDSPLHNTFTKFRGNVRVILLSKESQFMESRAQATNAKPTQYRKAIQTSEDFLKSLKNLGYSVDGRFYDGRSNWKLIITNRTCWMQYYLPGGPDVEKTPVYRFDATADGSGLYHYFCLEFERVWDRCDNNEMTLY